MQANALVMLSKANGNEAPHVGLHSRPHDGAPRAPARTAPINPPPLFAAVRRLPARYPVPVTAWLWTPPRGWPTWRTCRRVG